MSEDKATFTTDDTKAAKQAAEAGMEAAGTLPPAGAARQQEISRKAELLIRKAEELLAQIEVTPIDDGTMEVDREIRAALNEMTEVYVSNAQSDMYAYAWVFRDPTNECGGRYVRRMQALGWERIQGDMPEAKEHRSVDGSRVVADCLLMRIRLDRKLLLEKRNKLLREAKQIGIEAPIYDLADRANTRVLNTAEIMDVKGEPVSNHAATNRRANAQTRFHQLNVGGRMNQMLRTGTIPGVPSPGRSR